MHIKNPAKLAFLPGFQLFESLSSFFCIGPLGQLQFFPFLRLRASYDVCARSASHSSFSI